MLSNRFLASIHSRNESLINVTRELTINSLTSRYWQKKRIPEVCQSFTHWSNHLPWISRGEIPPRFSISYESYEMGPRITKLPEIAYGPNVSTNGFLSEFIAERWPNATTVYTDGSRLNEQVGCALYDTTNGHSRSFRLWNCASIYSAEAYAILQALVYAIELEDSCQQLVILSDSQSELSKLKNATPNSHLTFLEAEILRNAAELRKYNKSVHMIWIRGHRGIEGNTLVDERARLSTQIPLRMLVPPCFPHTDLRREFFLNLRRKWREFHSNYHAGRRYVSLFPPPTKQRWFQQLPATTPTNFIRTMTRLRTGHALTRSYLNAIQQCDSDVCLQCNTEPETLEHIFLSCPSYSAERNC
uniref:Pol polyprotein n=1 Tax=Lygus hesperus TaxID=30085 RepID=A0A146L9E2_LYGHE